MTNNELAQLILEEVREHISTVMFDTHDADPDCLLCQRGVELGVWARYGYPNGPWADTESAEQVRFPNDE